LDQDEYITEVLGKTSVCIDFISIKTSKGKSIAVGGQGGNPTTNMLPNTGMAHQIVGIGGGTGGSLHNIYLYYIN